MKKKFTAFLLTLILLLTVFSSAAYAYDEKLANEVTADYAAALSLADRRSFHGNCNLATAYQLRVRGIYDKDLDFSGSGDLWYDYFKDVSKTSGGYNVITISGKNCLYDLVEKYGSPIYNVVYSLGTGGTSGSTHALYIRAIIDGYVYFADSFGCTYGRTYYPEGTCTVLSIEKFISAYKGMNGDAYGCVYFSRAERVEHLAGSEQNPDLWNNDNTEDKPGKYIITASSLNLRSGAGTQFSSLGLIPNGVTVTVTEIDNGWGKTEYNGETGWISLEYALCINDNPNDPNNDMSNNLLALYLTAEKNAVISGSTITWTAGAEGGSDAKYKYSFEIYFDGTLLYTSDYQTDAAFSYTAVSTGEYQACVTVVDEQNNKAQLYGDTVICVSPDLLMGDVDGNGHVTSADARFVLRTAAKKETLSGEKFLRADMDKNGKITSSDARKILRIAAKLEPPMANTFLTDIRITPILPTIYAESDTQFSLAE